MAFGVGVPGALAGSARLTGTSVLVPVPKRALETELGKLRLELKPVPGYAEDQHPVWIDLAKLSDGQVAHQDEFAANVGAAAGAATGAAAWGTAGAAAGAAAGSLWGPIGAFWGGVAGGFWGASAGAAGGAAVGSTAWRAASEATRAAYNEVIVGVPNVVAEGGSRPYLFILGMNTDNTMAKWAGDYFNYGFFKELAQISPDAGAGTRYTVTRDGRPVLSANIRAENGRALDDEAQLGAMKELTSQPALGQVDATGETFAVSNVRRDYSQARVAPADVDLWVDDGFMRGVPGERYELREATPASQGVATAVSNVLETLDYPSLVPRSRL